MFFAAEQADGRRPGGPSPGQAGPGLPWDRVLILILLHMTTAVVCIALLTTLTRDPVLMKPGSARATTVSTDIPLAEQFLNIERALLH